MRVIVCGSRRWHNRQLIQDRLADLDGDTVIVHGAARGADRIAAEEAHKLGLTTEAHPAEWDTYGKRAGVIRNVQMADLGAARCIAFWDGVSAGTAHMTTIAEERGIPVELVREAS